MVDLAADARPVLVEPLGDPPGLGLVASSALDDGDHLVVVGRPAWPADPTAASASPGATTSMPGAAEPEVVAGGDGSGLAVAGPHGPGHLAGHDPLGRLGHGLGVGCRASASGSYSSRAAKPSAMPQRVDHPHRLAASAAACSATGMMFLLLGRTTTWAAGRGFDGLEDLGGRRVHRLPAGDDLLDAERAEDPPDPVAGGDRHHRAGDRLRIGRRRLGRRRPRGPSAPPRPARTGR